MIVSIGWIPQVGIDVQIRRVCLNTKVVCLQVQPEVIVANHGRGFPITLDSALFKDDDVVHDAGIGEPR